MLEKLVWNKLSCWSQKTFGTDEERGPKGCLEHLKLEAQEAIESPKDIKELADCFILIMDATRRSGFVWEELLMATDLKLEEVKNRVYLRTPEGIPCQHI